MWYDERYDESQAVFMTQLGGFLDSASISDFPSSHILSLSFLLKLCIFQSRLNLLLLPSVFPGYQSCY